MRSGTSTVRSLLIISLVLLPGILSLNNVAVYASNHTALSITLSASSITVGSPGGITVSATLIGATSTAVGTVIYQIFDGPSCSGTIQATDPQSVTAATVLPSMAFTMSIAGTFGVNAVYSGDINLGGTNLPSTSVCKQVKVTKFPTTIITTITPPLTFLVGGSVVDTATISGTNVLSSGGTVQYTLYFGGSCSGNIIQPPDQFPVTAPTGFSIPVGVPSSSFTINTPGTYSIRASYSGDPTNLGSTSLCEGPVFVVKVPPATVIVDTVAPVNPKAGQIQDTATLLGATSTAGGKVTYTLYSNGLCTAPPIPGISGTSVVTVTNGVPLPSKFFTVNTIGTYSFLAVYSGDANNGAGTSSCEPFTVVQATPTISTVTSPPFPTTILASNTPDITDTATLSGATSNAGGTITFTMYTASGTCTGPSVTPPGVPVSNDMATASFFSTTVGMISFKASYGGDANNVGTPPSACEGPITVGKAVVTVSTVLSANTIFTDGSVTDTVNIANSVGTITGETVTVTMYTGSGCSTSTGMTGSPTISGTSATTGLFTVPSNLAGTYSFNAVYPGDSNNAGPVTSPCEVLNVVKHTVGLSTTISPNPIIFPGMASDTATFTGLSTAPTGNAVFNLYNGGSCQGTSLQSATIAIAPTVTTGLFTIPSASTFSFSVVYAGDTNNAAVSTCEPFTVNKAIVSISTSLSPPSPISVGTPETDTATSTGFAAGATGTITFTLFTGSTCSGAVIHTVGKPFAGTQTFGTPAFTAGGLYSFLAVYSGDSNNAGATSACEPLTVLANPTITTHLSQGTITLAQSVFDTATLSGATATAGGTVTYQLFPPGVPCTGLPIDTFVVIVTNHIVPNSGIFSGDTDFPIPKTYCFDAVYSGDTFNNPSTSLSVGVEPLVVKATSPAVSTHLSAITVFADGTISDTATLTGATANAGGTISYTEYSTNTCATSYYGTGPLAVLNGVVPSSGPIPAAILGVPSGQASFQAVYTGDSNNNANSPVKSPCEVFTVKQHSTSLSTLLSATTISFGSGVTDSATLTGADATAGGTITYNLYANGACTGLIVPGQTDTETVTNDVVPPTSGPLTPSGSGGFGIKASYSGDSSNAPAMSTCEQITVTAIVVATHLSATAVFADGTISDTATLTGATANAGGTMSYTEFVDNTCTTSYYGTGPLNVVGGVVPPSGPIPAAILGVPSGQASFQAVYSGDANNHQASSSCEVFTINKHSPTLSTLLSASTITIVGSVTDTGTLTGASSKAIGTVTFTMYLGGSCSGTNEGSDTEIVTGGVVPTSGIFNAPSVNSFSFRAVYTGDSFDNPATSLCNEPLTVTKTSPTLTITPSFSTIVHGNTVTISSALFGATSDASGTVHIAMYADGSCSGSAIGSDTETVASGVVPTSGSFLASAAGSYSFNAVYSGDAKNNGAPNSGPSCVLVTAT